MQHINLCIIALQSGGVSLKSYTVCAFKWITGISDVFVGDSYTPKPSPLAATPNYFLQAENCQKICGLAEKLFYDKPLEKNSSCVFCAW